MNNDLISREEAIDVVRSLQVTLGGKGIFHPEAKKSVIGVLDDLPTIDAVEVVRCEECTFARNFRSVYVDCTYWRASVPRDGFCFCGAKMDAEVEG